jgi:hypothetical protein
MIRAGDRVRGWLNLSLTLFVMVSVGLVALLAASRWFAVVSGMIRTRPEEASDAPALAAAVSEAREKELQ